VYEGLYHNLREAIDVMWMGSVDALRCGIVSGKGQDPEREDPPTTAGNPKIEGGEPSAFF